MPDSIPLILSQRSSAQVRFQFRPAGESDPLPITEGMSVEMFVKAKPSASDYDPRTVKLSTETGELVVTDGGNGVCVAVIPESVTARAGIRWYRVDVIGVGGVSRQIAAKGQITVEPA